MKNGWVTKAVEVGITAIIVLGGQFLLTWRNQEVLAQKLDSYCKSNQEAHEAIIKSIDTLKGDGTKLAQENSKQIAGLTATVSSLTHTVDKLSSDVYVRRQ